MRLAIFFSLALPNHTRWFILEGLVGGMNLQTALHDQNQNSKRFLGHSGCLACHVEILSPSLRGLGSIKLAWRGWLTELVGLPNLLYPFVAGLIGGMRL